MNATDVPRVMQELRPEEQAVARAQASGVRIIMDNSSMTMAAWPARSSNSSRLLAPNPLAPGHPEPFYLPQSEQGLPMPPPDYVPPVQAPQVGQSEYGHWDFFSAGDREEAWANGFCHPSMVAYAAHCGMQGLSAIKLVWVPGWIEGSQSSRIGPTNAYVHIWMINERRRFCSGLQPMWPGELPLFTGTDAWWPARKGADAIRLDKLRFSNSYQDLPSLCEVDIVKKLETRQGYDASVAYDHAAAPRVQRSFPSQKTTDAWRIRLQMSNPRMELGGPLVARHPTTPNRPLDKRTTFHQASVNCGYGQDMPPINYLINRPWDLPIPSFVKRSKNVADGLTAPYPRLNPDDEQIWTMVRTYEDPGFQQVRLADLPFMFEVVDVNEDIALIEAWLLAGATWFDIPASMDEDECQYSSYYANQIAHVRYDLQLEAWRADEDNKTVATSKGVTKAWTDAEIAAKSGRGRVPGLINAGLPRTAANWTPYPKGYKDPSVNRDKNLKDQSVAYQRKSADARKAMVRAQSGQAPLASASDVPAKPKGVRRTADDVQEARPAKRSRKSRAKNNAATPATDQYKMVSDNLPMTPYAPIDNSRIGNLGHHAAQMHPAAQS